MSETKCDFCWDCETTRDAEGLGSSCWREEELRVDRMKYRDLLVRYCESGDCDGECSECPWQ